MVDLSPTNLTAKTQGLVAAALARRKTELGNAATSRARLLAQLKTYKQAKNVGAIRAVQARLGQVTKDQAAAQRRYDSYKKVEYNPYQAKYTQLTNLDKKSPTLDGVLNQLTPFDPEAAGQRLGAQQALNQALLASKQGRDELAQDYATGQRTLSTEEPGRYRALLSNFAGRGFANSSGYATAFGDETADYAKRQNDLNSQNQRGTAQYALADSGAQADYLSSIAGILSDTTGRMAANAGQLGMAGNSNLPLLLEIARRRLAAGGS